MHGYGYEYGDGERGTIPRDLDTGVRFEWQTDAGPEAVPFYDVGG